MSGKSCACLDREGAQLTAHSYTPANPVYQAIMSFPWSYSVLGLVPGYVRCSVCGILAYSCLSNYGADCLWKG